MQYFGGKAKIAKYIVSYLESVRKENQIFVEPFVGGANIVSQMSGKRKAYDFNEYLIEMYKSVQNGYELPNHVTEEEYKHRVYREYIEHLERLKINMKHMSIIKIKKSINGTIDILMNASNIQDIISKFKENNLESYKNYN